MLSTKLPSHLRLQLHMGGSRFLVVSDQKVADLILRFMTCKKGIKLLIALCCPLMCISTSVY